MSPVLLYQNYHLVHHLHPLVPFYQYVVGLAAQRGAATWRATRR